MKTNVHHVGCLTFVLAGVAMLLVGGDACGAGTWQSDGFVVTGNAYQEQSWTGSCHQAAWTRPGSDKSEFFSGLSIQWLPMQNTRLEVVRLFGRNDVSAEAGCWLIFGFDFGSGSEGGYKPVTTGGL